MKTKQMFKGKKNVQVGVDFRTHSNYLRVCKQDDHILDTVLVSYLALTEIQQNCS